MTPRHAFAATLAAVAAAAPAAAGTAHAAPADPAPKAVVIGIDGAMLDRIGEAGTPNLDALMAEGSTASALLPEDSPTLSGPSWSTIATGVWPAKHGVRGNELSPNDFDAYPDLLTRAERDDPGRATFAAATWAPLTSTASGGPVFSAEVDEAVAAPSGAGDDWTAERTAEHLAGGSADASFVQLDEVDAAGHEHGADSPRYTAALEEADRRVGEILAAIEERPQRAEEDWLVVVASDHGHLPGGGHGGSSDDERSVFVIARGGGIPAGASAEASIADVAPTVLHHLGVPLGGDLDGSPISAGS